MEPTHQASESVSWQTYEDARGGVVAMYATLRAALRDHYRYYMYGDMRGGDFTPTNRTDLLAIKNNNLTASYDFLNDLRDWQPFYATINACNLFLERSGGCLADVRYTEQNNKVDLAEARTIRALTYLYLVMNWGDVPLLTKSYDGVFPNVAKSSAAEILSFIETDLKNSVDDLPWYYGSGSNAAGYPAILPGNYYEFTNYQIQNAAIGKVGAYAILAHIAEWEGHWDDVVSYTKFIRDNFSSTGGYYYSSLSSMYSSTDNLVGNDVFGIMGDRGMYRPTIYFPVIWSYNEAGVTGEGYIENLTIAYPLISKSLPDIYVTKDTIGSMFTDNADARFGFDTITGQPKEAYFTNYNSAIPIFKKIYWAGNQGGSGSTGSSTSFAWTSNIVWTRLEELMSLRAVALAVTEGNNSIEGLSLLNAIRLKRGMKALSNSDDLVSDVFAERRREFIGEGWRWFDKVVYNKIKRNDPDFNKLIDEGGIYWPISNKALKANPLLTQNPYWTSKK
jgi:hypothetical protein